MQRQAERISCQNITQPGERISFFGRVYLTSNKEETLNYVFSTWSSNLIIRRKWPDISYFPNICTRLNLVSALRECLNQQRPHSKLANPDGTCPSDYLARSGHLLYLYYKEKLGGAIAPCDIHPLLRE